VARKSWDQLSPAYRQRLERSGYTSRDYAANKPRTAARGHAHTPEHPNRAHPVKHKEYLERKANPKPKGRKPPTREQKDRRNARERARRYSQLPQTEREREWAKHSQDALFWANFNGDSGQLIAAVNR
jgi:hypothetical protein